MNVQYPQVTVRLVGTDGNAFALIGAVSRALKNAGERDAAEAFTQSAFAAKSYDALLQLICRTVEVE